ncbi:hypothetical protein LCGC14_1197670 [marine sediment metagenome]|uniref:SnoaL-like domain-containing protein n=1 Tax=marine sediment metagenome TaxID=412755 RepID=A0A0F9LHU0_9ZZZZ|nr:hypothetical protein [archaeon]HEC39405.1 hypothetical protein [bacterium]
MNRRDPKLTALQFNEYINNQDINGLTNLMTEDHIFIDREGNFFNRDMINGWKRFFNDWPTYKNVFTRVESRENLVILIGYALWSKDSKEEDYSIWTATIENDLVAKWQIFEDIEDNRKKIKIT